MQSLFQYILYPLYYFKWKNMYHKYLFMFNYSIVFRRFFSKIKYCAKNKRNTTHKLIFLFFTKPWYISKKINADFYFNWRCWKPLTYVFVYVSCKHCNYFHYYYVNVKIFSSLLLIHNLSIFCCCCCCCYAKG